MGEDEEDEFYPGSRADVRLDQARQRAKDSMEALRMELHGFGSAVSVRYASWPPGAAVRVSLPRSEDDGDDESRCLYARLVRHNPGQKTFEVKLRDGSARVVPEK